MIYKVIWFEVTNPITNEGACRTQSIEADSALEAAHASFAGQEFEALPASACGGDIVVDAHPKERVYFRLLN